MTALWISVPNDNGNDLLPRGIILDPAISQAFESAFDEIAEQYIGDFIPDLPSDLGILLVLAKRCYHDQRYEQLQDDLLDLIYELSNLAENVIHSITDFDELLQQHHRRHDLVASSDDDDSTTTDDDDLTFRDTLMTMRLALFLDRQVLVIPKEEATPIPARLFAFPRQNSGESVRFWFSYDHELLSRKVLWDQVPDLIMSDVWDFSAMK